jgi:hypothetical protein
VPTTITVVASDGSSGARAAVLLLLLLLLFAASVCANAVLLARMESAEATATAMAGRAKRLASFKDLLTNGPPLFISLWLHSRLELREKVGGWPKNQNDDCGKWILLFAQQSTVPVSSNDHRI